MPTNPFQHKPYKLTCNRCNWSTTPSDHQTKQSSTNTAKMKLSYVLIFTAALVGCAMASPKGNCLYNGDYLADSTACQTYYICEEVVPGSGVLTPNQYFCPGASCFYQTGCIANRDQCGCAI